MSKKLQILLPILLAGFAGLLVAGYLNDLKKTYKRGAEEAVVLVAKNYIEKGTMISADMVEELKIPAQYIQPKALTSKADLVNKEGNLAYMSIVPVVEKEQLVTTKLAPLGFETGVSAVIPTDMRSVIVAADGPEVVGIIRPGSRVDVLVSLDYEQGGKRMQEAVTLLQHVQVLAVGRRIVGSVDPRATKQGGMGAITAEEDLGTGRVPVSLSVTPQEAELLALAKTKGQVILILRGIGDEKIFKLPGIELSKLADRVKDVVRPSPKSPAELAEERKKREIEQILRRYPVPAGKGGEE